MQKAELGGSAFFVLELFRVQENIFAAMHLIKHNFVSFPISVNLFVRALDAFFFLLGIGHFFNHDATLIYPFEIDTENSERRPFSTLRISQIGRYVHVRIDIEVVRQFIERDALITVTRIGRECPNDETETVGLEHTFCIEFVAIAVEFIGFFIDHDFARECGIRFHPFAKLLEISRNLKDATQLFHPLHDM